MKQFEYATISFSSDSEVIPRLNDFAKDGWEPVCFQSPLLMIIRRTITRQKKESTEPQKIEASVVNQEESLEEPNLLLEQPKENPSPNSAPPPSLHHAFIDRYDTWLKAHGHPGFGAENAGRDAKGIKRLTSVVRKYVQMAMPETRPEALDDTTLRMWERILAQYENLEPRDSFNKSCYLNPTQMASHFPALWDRLKELNSEEYKSAKRRRELHGVQRETSTYAPDYVKKYFNR